MAQENLDAAKELAAELAAGKVELAIKVGEKEAGTFGSVSSKEIAAAVKEQMKARCGQEENCPEREYQDARHAYGKCETSSGSNCGTEGCRERGSVGIYLTDALVQKG